jgi:hypothetical protein
MTSTPPTVNANKKLEELAFEEKPYVLKNRFKIIQN